MSLEDIVNLVPEAKASKMGSYKKNHLRMNEDIPVFHNMNLPIIARIKEMSERFPNHVNFKPQERSVADIARYIGRIPGKIDRAYLELLKHFNRISIGDLFIYGIKERSNDVFTVTTDNWVTCDFLTHYFITVGKTSFGQNIGYLDHLRNGNGDAAIGNVQDLIDPPLAIISSSFENFLNVLLSFIECNATSEKVDAKFAGAFLGILNDVDFWMEHDEGLRAGYNLKLYRNSLQYNWRLANGFKVTE